MHQNKGCQVIYYLNNITVICSSESCEDLQCMLQTEATTIIMGGHQPQLIEFDLVTAKEIRKVR